MKKSVAKDKFHKEYDTKLRIQEMKFQQKKLKAKQKFLLQSFFCKMLENKVFQEAIT